MPYFLVQDLKLSKYNIHNGLFFIACIFSIIFSFFVHIWNLNSLPPGFYIDESSIGYNAWSILETGKDEYGHSYPVFFKCFGNYQHPSIVYSVAVSEMLFGVGKWQVRLPSAIWFLATSFVFFFLSKGFVGGRWIPLLSALLFSVLPWVFPISRSCMSGYTPMLFGIVLGCHAFHCMLANRSHLWAILSAAAWSFAVYSHHGMPLIVPLTLFVIALLIVKPLMQRWKVSLSFGVSLFIFMFPMIFVVFRDPAQLITRSSQVSLWNVGASFGEVLGNIMIRYFDYIGINFLFLRGDSNLRHHTGFCGVLPIGMLPPIIFGLWLWITRWRRNPLCRILLASLLLSPVAAMLTVERFHATRTVNGAVFWSLAFAFGLRFLWKLKKTRWARILCVVSVAASVLQSTIYIEDYFTDYLNRSSKDFMALWNKIIVASFNAMSPNDTLYIHPTALPDIVDYQFKPFIYADILFAGRIPPSEYQKEGKIPISRVSPYIGGPIPKNGVLASSRQKGESAPWDKSKFPLPKDLSMTLLKQIPFNDLIFEVYLVKNN